VRIREAEVAVRVLRGLVAMWVFGVVITAVIVKAAVTGADLP